MNVSETPYTLFSLMISKCCNFFPMSLVFQLYYLFIFGWCNVLIFFGTPFFSDMPLGRVGRRHPFKNIGHPSQRASVSSELFRVVTVEVDNNAMQLQDILSKWKLSVVTILWWLLGYLCRFSNGDRELMVFGVLNHI